MTLTAPSKNVAAFDKGRLATGISATATTITVSPIFKTVNGVRTKQGFDSTSGECIISQGGFDERISFEGSSVDATTKVTTLTTCTRGLPVTNTTANFTGGTGRVWAKGAFITVIDSASYNQSSVFVNATNAFTGANSFAATSTFNAPVIVAGTTSYVKLPELTSTQRDALTGAEGMLIKNSTTGTVQQYVGGAWSDVGDTGTSNASTTVAGKVEEATAAEIGASTASGATGARLFINPSSVAKTSSGAGDENKLPVLGSGGQLATGFIPAANPAFGTGADGSVTISGNTQLSADKNYTDLTINTGVILDPNGYRIYVSGTLTLTGTAKIATDVVVGGVGGTSTSAVGGIAGTAGVAAHSAGTLPASLAGVAGIYGADGDGGSDGGAAGLAGIAGTASAIAVSGNGVAGGAGGASGSPGAGGTAGAAGTGTATSEILLFNAFINPLQTTTAPTFGSRAASGSGGGGGGGDRVASNTEAGGGGGGASGSNGGHIFVAAQTITGSGTIEAIGGAGGAGGAGHGGSNHNGGGGGGGGGGGNGGWIILVYRIITGWSGSAIVTGGAGGAGGAAGSGAGGGVAGVAGSAGTTGASGKVYEYKVITY